MTTPVLKQCHGHVRIVFTCAEYVISHVIIDNTHPVTMVLLCNCSLVRWTSSITSSKGPTIADTTDFSARLKD